MMSEFNQRLKSERPGAALDRVNGPENRVHRFDLVLLVHHQAETVIHGFQKILAFLKEGISEIVTDHDAHETPRATATRSIAATSFISSKGLTIQPVAPAARARDFSSGALSVVSTRIGRLRLLGEPRIASMKPKPSSRGMLMSVMTTSGRAFWSCCKPSSPSSARWTSKPA